MLNVLFKTFAIWSLIAMCTLMWTPVEKEFDYPVPPLSPEAVAAANDCWRESEPALVDIPGHVVYADSDEGAKVGGADKVHDALEQVFNGVDSGMRIYAFCR